MKHSVRLLFVSFSIVICACITEAQWAQASLPGTSLGGFTFLSMGSSLYAGTNNGIYVTADSAKSWKAAMSGLTSTYVMSLCASGTTLYAGTDYGSTGIFSSNDSGATWGASSSGVASTSIYALAAVDTDVFAGTYGSGVYHATNKSGGWTAANSGLSNLFAWCLSVSGHTLYAGTYGGGIFRSTDKGATWNSLAASGLTDANITTLLVNGNRIYAGTWSSGLFLSTDSGAHFTAINNGLTSLTINALIAIPKTGGGYDLLTGGASNRGVFLSSDSGASWSAFNSGLDISRQVDALALCGRTLLVGTTTKDDIGLWKRSLSDISTGISLSDNRVPATFKLAQNYPNPFNPTTTIRYEIPGGTYGHTSLRVYDIMGREVATLVNETKEAGSYQVTFNASKLASGVYFYKLQAGNYTSVKKLLLLK
jgi:hypothetical protein